MCSCLCSSPLACLMALCLCSSMWRCSALLLLLSLSILIWHYNCITLLLQGTKQQASLQQLPLLLPAFRASDAWQYSSSNLLRLAQQGPGGGFEPSKSRFKPVANPEALLRKPKMSVRQLRGDARTALQVGRSLYFKSRGCGRLKPVAAQHESCLDLPVLQSTLTHAQMHVSHTTRSTLHNPACYGTRHIGYKVHSTCVHKAGRRDTLRLILHSAAACCHRLPTGAPRGVSSRPPAALTAG